MTEPSGEPPDKLGIANPGESDGRGVETEPGLGEVSTSGGACESLPVPSAGETGATGHGIPRSR